MTGSINSNGNRPINGAYHQDVPGNGNINHETTEGVMIVESGHQNDEFNASEAALLNQQDQPLIFETEDGQQLTAEEAAAEQVYTMVFGSDDDGIRDKFDDEKGERGIFGHAGDGIKNLFNTKNSSGNVDNDIKEIERAARKLKRLARQGKTEEFAELYKEISGFDYDPSQPIITEDHPELIELEEAGQNVFEEMEDIKEILTDLDDKGTGLGDRVNEIDKLLTDPKVGDVRKKEGGRGDSGQLKDLIRQLEENVDSKYKEYDDKSKNLSKRDQEKIRDVITRLKALEGDVKILEEQNESLVSKGNKRVDEYGNSQFSWRKGLIVGAAAFIALGAVALAPFTGGTSLVGIGAAIAVGATAGGVGAAALTAVDDVTADGNFDKAGEEYKDIGISGAIIGGSVAGGNAVGNRVAAHFGGKIVTGSRIGYVNRTGLTPGQRAIAAASEGAFDGGVGGFSESYYRTGGDLNASLKAGALWGTVGAAGFGAFSAGLSGYRAVRSSSGGSSFGGGHITPTGGPDGPGPILFDGHYGSVELPSGSLADDVTAEGAVRATTDGPINPAEGALFNADDYLANPSLRQRTIAAFREGQRTRQFIDYLKGLRNKSTDELTTNDVDFFDLFGYADDVAVDSTTGGLRLTERARNFFNNFRRNGVEEFTPEQLDILRWNGIVDDAIDNPSFRQQVAAGFREGQGLEIRPNSLASRAGRGIGSLSKKGRELIEKAQNAYRELDQRIQNNLDRQLTPDEQRFVQQSLLDPEAAASANVSPRLRDTVKNALSTFNTALRRDLAEIRDALRNLRAKSAAGEITEAEDHFLRYIDGEFDTAAVNPTRRQQLRAGFNGEVGADSLSFNTGVRARATLDWFNDIYTRAKESLQSRLGRRLTADEDAALQDEILNLEFAPNRISADGTHVIDGPFGSIEVAGPTGSRTSRAMEFFQNQYDRAREALRNRRGRDLTPVEDAQLQDELLDLHFGVAPLADDVVPNPSAFELEFERQFTAALRENLDADLAEQAFAREFADALDEEISIVFNESRDFAGDVARIDGVTLNGGPLVDTPLVSHEGLEAIGRQLELDNPGSVVDNIDGVSFDAGPLTQDIGSQFPELAALGRQLEADEITASFVDDLALLDNTLAHQPGTLDTPFFHGFARFDDVTFNPFLAQTDELPIITTGGRQLGDNTIVGHPGVTFSTADQTITLPGAQTVSVDGATVSRTIDLSATVLDDTVPASVTSTLPGGTLVDPTYGNLVRYGQSGRQLLDLNYHNGGGSTWIYSNNLSHNTPYKFHIHASTSEELANLNDVVLPYLNDVGAGHKFAQNGTLERLASGQQAGKGITVYANSADELLELAQQVDQRIVANGLDVPGSTIQGDNLLAGNGFGSGRVHYRYGFNRSLTEIEQLAAAEGISPEAYIRANSDNLYRSNDGIAVPDYQVDEVAALLQTRQANNVVGIHASDATANGQIVALPNGRTGEVIDINRGLVREVNSDVEMVVPWLGSNRATGEATESLGKP